MSILSKATQRSVIPAALCLLLSALTAQAVEYRLIIGDTASCRANGKTGPDCVVAASASSSGGSTTTSSTSTTSTTSSGGSSTGSATGCTVTVWNPCSNSGSSTTSVSSTSTVTSTPTTTTTTTTVSQPASPPPASTTATMGTLDFGSGGYDANGASIPFDVSGNVTTLPFTVVAGKYSGQVGITPTSSGFPYDGTGVRMWWSRAKGGAPLNASSCAGNLKSEGFLYWQQGGALSYGCAIPNENTTLYLNLQACISSRTDGTCSASGARAGSAATVYLFAVKQ